MAENKRPTFVDDNTNPSRDGGNRSEKRVDFASLASRKAKASRNSPVPMAMRPQNRNIEEEEDRRRESLADTQRVQLISPPPEETLRRNSRPSSQFTPSLLATASSPGPVQGSTIKRKRSQRAPASTTPLLDTQSDGIADSDMAREPVEAQQAVEATPNPKPRKQGRHTRAPSTEVESPTRGSFNSAARSTTQSEGRGKKDLNTTPSRPKQVIVQSPHATNPDADYVLPVSLSSLSAAPARRAVLGARASRRSVTPIPPYEPPTDVFTPPRVVFMSPATKTVSKSSKRKTPATSKASTRKAKASSLRVVTTQVKQEIPDDIDLTAPMPPPSPSDDPLLLSGPPEPPIESSPSKRPAARRHSISIPVENEVLPPSSPELLFDSEDVHAVKAFEWDRLVDGSMDTEEDSMMRLDDPRDADVAPVRLFDFDDADYGSGDVGGWSDNDDEIEQDKGKGKKLGDFEEEGEGEYTGKWKMIKVPTKQDPPSSATRTRMELWGRPISPFPKVKVLDLVGEDEEEEAGMSVESEGVELMESSMSKEGQDRASIEQELEDDEDVREEEQVRKMSVEPEETVESLVTFVPGEASQSDEEEERQVREMSIEIDEEDSLSNQEMDLPDMLQSAREPSPAPTVVDIPPSKSFSLPSVESLEDFSSLEPDTQTVIDEDSQMQGVASEFKDSMVDDEGDSVSDMEDMPSFVKITSADPRAAARAAAILKQHDYDCFTRIIEKAGKRRRASHSGVDDLAKESRRRDVTTSGITKPMSKNRRRSTPGMGVIGDRVFIPGTPVMTLPELLKEAEVEVGRELEHDHHHGVRSSSELWSTSTNLEGSGQRDPFKTPIPDRYRAKLSAQDVPVTDNQSPLYESGERPWTKEEWKLLDACFTDERLDLGATLKGVPEGTLAPVDMVSAEDVVERFIRLVGGEEVVQICGEAWSRENLLQRTLALQRKQRAGNFARPTTPRSTPFTFSPSVALSKDAGALGGKNIVPSIEVPDFTPLGRRSAPPPRRSRPVLPQPLGQAAPFANILEETKGSLSRRVPPTLLAPRYSHLLDEAKSISQGDVTSHQDEQAEKNQVNETQGSLFGGVRYVSSSELSPSDTFFDLDNQTDRQLTTNRPQPAVDTQNATIGKRVKGFLFSYLPTLSSKTSASLSSHKPNTIRRPGLPLPPPNLLEKVRGPVATPARQPLPKPKHPKELVQLHPAPPSVASALSRSTKPRRLVELHPLPPSLEKPIVAPSASVRPRRSSGASVKDLVKGFEDIQRLEREKLDNNPLRKVKSIGDVRKKHNSAVDTRPRWKF